MKPIPRAASPWLVVFTVHQPCSLVLFAHVILGSFFLPPKFCQSATFCLAPTRDFHPYIPMKGSFSQPK